MVDSPSPSRPEDDTAGPSQAPDKHGYPRPQLRRESWTSLNGVWDFALDEDAEWTSPSAVRWSASINVPFSPETAASGLKANGFFQSVWYRRRFDSPARTPESGFSFTLARLITRPKFG